MIETLNKIDSNLSTMKDVIQLLLEKYSGVSEILNSPEFQIILNESVRLEVEKQLAKPEPDPVDQWNEILSVDFTGRKEGEYTQSNYSSDFKTTRKLKKVAAIELIGGKTALISHYPKDKWGDDSGFNQFVSLLPRELEEVKLSYKLRFEEGFDWGLVGKLPGVGFGPVSTVAGGGGGTDIGDKGASVRIIWGINGFLSPYLYHHGGGVEYGSNMGKSAFAQLTAGVEHHIEMYVKANTIGKADGIMIVTLDGKPVLTLTNLVLRTATSPQYIQEFILGTFMGGDDIRFAPNRTQKMGIYEIKVYEPNKKL